MELSHSFTVPASVDAAWAIFMDLEQVGACFPGATVTSATADGFEGTVKVKLGPIALVYAGSGTFVERDDAAHRAVIEAKGKDKRGNGTAGATVTIQLSDTGDGSTRADVQTDLAVTGKPAQFGRGVMQDVSDKLLQQFVDCIEGRFTEPSAPPAPAVTPASHEPSPSEAATAPSAAPAAQPEQASHPNGTRFAPPGERDDAIDLGSTVLPVVLRSYGKQIAGAALALLAILGLARRRRRRPPPAASWNGWRRSRAIAASTPQNGSRASRRTTASCCARPARNHGGFAFLRYQRAGLCVFERRGAMPPRRGPRANGSTARTGASASRCCRSST